MALNIYITVDAEIWPAADDGWPRVPLKASQKCEREIEAYVFGNCAAGAFGLPYQLDVLQRHGMRATYFVDPMSSFALGMQPLRDMVELIQGHGQRVELHLHPEWLTDPRCPSLPTFKGPYISDYDEETQYRLICIARDRLIEAGARPPTAFRAGSWGASRATLRALARAGIRFDASLNACYAHSLPDLPQRESPHIRVIDGVTELPMTKFDDRVLRHGRPLSFVGVSAGEMRHTLGSLHRSGADTAVIVMHGNEFVRTESLYQERRVSPRRLIVRRFESFCRYVTKNSESFETKFVSDCVHGPGTDASSIRPVIGHRLRTAQRMLEQVISRWY